MEQQSFTQRSKSAFARLLVFLLIVGLGSAVVFLLSQLNARTFTLQVSDNSLVVMKGRLFPTGMERYHPADPSLKDAYAPIPLEGTGIGSLSEQHFTERDDLDRALFDV